MSRVGKKPVAIPAGVTAKVEGQKVSVKGAKGSLDFTVPDDVEVALADGHVSVKPRSESKRAQAMWGMSRAMIANIVTGVSANAGKRLAQRGSGASAKAAVGLNRVETDFMRFSRRWAAPSIDDSDEIRGGLPVGILEELNGLLPGTVNRIVPRSTLAALKKRSDRLPPEQSDRVYQAGKVIGFATAIYQDEDKVRSFLTRPHPMLKDRSPLDVVLESSAGADVVINLLGRGAYGGGAEAPCRRRQLIRA